MIQTPTTVTDSSGNHLQQPSPRFRTGVRQAAGWFARCASTRFFLIPAPWSRQSPNSGCSSLASAPFGLSKRARGARDLRHPSWRGSVAGRGSDRCRATGSLQGAVVRLPYSTVAPTTIPTATPTAAHSSGLVLSSAELLAEDVDAHHHDEPTEHLYAAGPPRSARRGVRRRSCRRWRRRSCAGQTPSQCSRWRGSRPGRRTTSSQ